MKTATPDEPKTVHNDPRYAQTRANFDRIQGQKNALIEKIGDLESRLAEPQAFSHRARLDQAALRVLDGSEAPSPIVPRGALSGELARARGELSVLNHAIKLASERFDEVAGEISAGLLPEIVRQNREHNRRALRLDIERSRQHAAHESFIAMHEADGVKALPGIEFPSTLGILSDPYSVIRERCREALRLGIVSEGELQRILEGGNL